MSDKRSAALGFIFVTILIDVIGLGIIIPVLPKLIEQLTGEGISRASQYAGWLSFTYAIMQFCFAPLIGGLSDKWGRRPVLLASLLGLGLDYIFLVFAPTIAWLFVGRVIAGIAGASFTTATAYIADISTPENRAQNFGMVGAAFGVGFIIGPVIGGQFAHLAPHVPGWLSWLVSQDLWTSMAQLGPRLPFAVAAVMSLLNFLYGAFILPESLTPERRRAFDWKRANPVGTLLQLGRYPSILGLVVSLVLLYLAGSATQSVWTFYTMLKFKWTEDMIGYSLGVIGLCTAIVQGGLVRIAIPKLACRRPSSLACCAMRWALSCLRRPRRAG